MEATQAVPVSYYPNMDAPQQPHSDPSTIEKALEYFWYLIITIISLFLGWLGKIFLGWVMKIVNAKMDEMNLAVQEMKVIANEMKVFAEKLAQSAQRDVEIIARQEKAEKDIREIRDFLKMDDKK